MQSNAYTVGFAAAITVVCSLLLSGVSGALKDKQEENRVVDRQKNILAALGVPTPKKDGEETLSPADQLKDFTAQQVQELYQKRVNAQVIDGSGNVVEGKTPNDLPPKIASGEGYDPKQGMAVYSLRDEANAANVLAYAYPVTGKGLWSTLYGYLAVKPDGDEIVGLSFYKHGETPGLGANIEKQWFRDNFVGKKLYEGGKLVGVTVVKGKAADQAVPQAKKDNYMVDGMSGATITGNGVTKMMRTKPRRYEAFFKKVASGPAPKKAPPPAPPTTPPGEQPVDDGTAPPPEVVPEKAPATKAPAKAEASPQPLTPGPTATTTVPVKKSPAAGQPPPPKAKPGAPAAKAPAAKAVPAKRVPVKKAPAAAGGTK